MLSPVSWFSFAPDCWSSRLRERKWAIHSAYQTAEGDHNDILQFSTASRMTVGWILTHVGSGPVFVSNVAFLNCICKFWCRDSVSSITFHVNVSIFSACTDQRSVRIRVLAPYSNYFLSRGLPLSRHPSELVFCPRVTWVKILTEKSDCPVSHLVLLTIRISSGGCRLL